MAEQVFAPGQPVGWQIPTNKPRDWFSYPITFTTLVNGTPQSSSIQIDAGSDFYLTALTQVTTISGETSAITASTYPIPLATLLITDSGSNRQLMQNPVPISLIAGDGAWPHRLIHPRLFLRNSAIQIVVQSFDANFTYSRITLNFEGFRIYQ